MFAMLLLALYLALYPAIDGPRSRAGSIARAGRARPVLRAGRVGRHRVRARLSVRRISLGAARQQPGDGAAGRAAGERARRLRTVGAGGLRQRDAGVRAADVRARARIAVRRRRGGRAGRRRRVGHVADRRRIADARGHADPRRPGAGQHRAGRQVEPERGAAHLHDLHRDDARRRAPRRAVRDLARVVHAVHVRGCDDIPRASASCASSRARCACRFCSAAIRSIGASARVELYNAAFLLAPDGTTAAVYRKIHLVPFGEFIPFQRLARLRSAAGRSGSRRSRLAPVGHAAGRRRIGSSTAICYEVVYPVAGRATRCRAAASC